MAKWKIWLVGIMAVITDMAVFFFLNLMLMAYNDSHDPDVRDYDAWGSYTFTDKIAVVSLTLWWLVNVTAICCVLYKAIKRWLAVKVRPGSTF